MRINITVFVAALTVSAIYTPVCAGTGDWSITRINDPEVDRLIVCLRGIGYVWRTSIDRIRSDLFVTATDAAGHEAILMRCGLKTSSN